MADTNLLYERWKKSLKDDHTEAPWNALELLSELTLQNFPKDWEGDPRLMWDFLQSCSIYLDLSLRACKAVEDAYVAGDEEHVDWEGLDNARSKARVALGLEEEPIEEVRSA